MRVLEGDDICHFVLAQCVFIGASGRVQLERYSELGRERRRDDVLVRVSARREAEGARREDDHVVLHVPVRLLRADQEGARTGASLVEQQYQLNAASMHVYQNAFTWRC